MNWLIWLGVFMMIVSAGVFEVDSTRIALAADIESGRLYKTDKAEAMIKKGDEYLNGASQNRLNRGFSVMAIDKDLFAAFIAKVWYERARLEMEISDKQS